MKKSVKGSVLRRAIILLCLALVTALLSTGLMTGCSPSDGELGGETISVFGDSITQGANCPDIPNESYIGIVRKELNARYASGNYGFVSMHSKMSNTSGVYQEIHQVSANGFNSTSNGKYINAMAYVGSTQGSTIDIEVYERFNEAYVYYYACDGYGAFDVLVNGEVVMSVDCSEGTTEALMVSDPVDISAYDNAEIQIKITRAGQVVITGMAYYDDPADFVINNYALDGLRLTQLSDEVIDQICDADTVIFALGFNDSYNDDADVFSQKINKVIEAVKKYGCKLYVNDFVWTGDAATNHYKLELQRLAEECSGTYIDYVGEIGQEMLDAMGDWAHPSVEGHRLIAELLLSKIELPEEGAAADVTDSGAQA